MMRNMKRGIVERDWAGGAFECKLLLAIGKKMDWAVRLMPP